MKKDERLIYITIPIPCILNGISYIMLSNKKNLPSRQSFHTLPSHVLNVVGIKIFPVYVTCKDCGTWGWKNRTYIYTYSIYRLISMWSDACQFQRSVETPFGVVGTETPSRFGGRRYGRTTNPTRRFEERFQYGSDVRLAERRTSALCLMRMRDVSSFSAALCKRLLLCLLSLN